MYDPDAGHRHPLRLAAATKPAPIECPKTVDALADDPIVLECLRMLSNATLVARAQHAQAQPISAQRRPTVQTDAQHLARYQDADPLWRLHMGEHDARIHQHAAGPHPMVFRTTGHAERLDAAARGEIGNAAEDLRQERLAEALNDPAYSFCLDAPL